MCLVTEVRIFSGRPDPRKQDLLSLRSLLSLTQDEVPQGCEKQVRTDKRGAFLFAGPFLRTTEYWTSEHEPQSLDPPSMSVVSLPFSVPVPWARTPEIPVTTQRTGPPSGI